MSSELIIVVKTSLKICFMYGAMKEGNILFFLRQFFEWILAFLPEKVNLYIRKPLFDCLFCMSSLWGITFTYRLFDFKVDYLFLILEVAGLNYLISTIIHWYHDQAERDETYHDKIEKKEDAIKKKAGGKKTVARKPIVKKKSNKQRVTKN